MTELVAEVTVKEATEAHVRRLMARRAALLPVTYLNRSERAELLVEINAELGRWNEMV